MNKKMMIFVITGLLIVTILAVIPLGITVSIRNKNNHMGEVFMKQVNDKSYPQILWWYDLQAPSFGSSAVDDIDHDGKPEIVFGTYFNDGHVYAINAENGTLLWSYDTGGCNDASPVIADVDLDGYLEVIIPASSPGIVYCFNGTTGSVKWSRSTGYCIDSPPAVADVDDDNKPEVVFGTFQGFVFCLNGEDGSICWQRNLGTNSYIQSCPNILDLDDDQKLDIVVAQWSGDHRIYALYGENGSTKWYSSQPQDWMYHGGSFADIDEDNKPEIAIGCYDNHLYVVNGEDGSPLWDYTTSFYIGAPTSIADLNNDNHLEIVFVSYNTLGVLSHTGTLLWSYPAGGNIFRGAAISDVNGDGILDVAFGADDGIVRILRGDTGQVIWTYDLQTHYGNTFKIDHAPVIADFNNDGQLDLFVIGGYGTSSSPTNNHGRAYALTAGAGNGSGWPMFRYDIKHSACFSAGNLPPVAVDDYAYVMADSFVDIDVIANDYDCDGTIDPTSVHITDFSLNGSLNVNLTTGYVLYTPFAGFSGTDLFSYTIMDDDGSTSNSASVHIIIVPENMSLIDIFLYAGWNLITIPLQNNFTASTLLNYIPGAMMISAFDAQNQTYKSYATGDPPPYDFVVINGYGYFIYMNQDAMVYFTGGIIPSVSVPLYTGYNMIGWYQPANTTASTLLAAIPGSMMASIFDPVNQTYRSYAVGDPPTYDVTIIRGMGVFIWTNQQSIWDGTD